MKKLIWLVILLATILRIYNIQNVPPSPSLDESSIAWNAYSVLRTGGDEFGSFPLISQRGYDDFRRSTYLLISIPFVALFHLTPIAIRLPAVLLSVATVWAVYSIMLSLYKEKSRTSYLAALSAAFFLAISPWHIYISRIGHESNACLSFFVFAILFFLKGLEKNKHMIVSAIFFILAMISYYSGQILVPLFVFALCVLFFKELKTIIFKNYLTIALTILIAFIATGVLFSLFSPEALIRYRGTSTLSSEVHAVKFSEWVQKRNEAKQKGNIIGTIIYNRRIFFIKVLVEGYLSHFQLNWLFSNTGNDSFKSPNTGLLYIWQIPYILLGISVLFISKNIKIQYKALIFIWFLLGALPGSVATQAPHAMRAYNILPVWHMFTAIGFVGIYAALKKFKYVLFIITIFLCTLSIKHFSDDYFVTFPKEQSKSFQYAFAQAIPVIQSIEKNYKKIILSNEDNLYQSYMLFLFHTSYDPKIYKKQGGTISGGYKETHAFGKYEFKPIKWDQEEKNNILFVGNPNDFPPQAKRLYEFKYLDGTVGVIISAEH